MRFAVIILASIALSACGQASVSPETAAPEVTYQTPSPALCDELSQAPTGDVYIQLTLTKLFITPNGIYERTDASGRTVPVKDASLNIDYCILRVDNGALSVEPVPTPNTTPSHGWGI